MQTCHPDPFRKVWVLANKTYQPAITFSNKSQKEKQIECRLETNNQKIIVSSKQCYARSSQQKSFDDMCTMNILNQPEIFYNLKTRYLKNQIYTAIGTTILAINPYQKLKFMYSQQPIQKLQSIKAKIIKGEQIENISPHVYTLSGRAYLELSRTGKKQAIVISGQSGAGKTQNTKYCMKFITSLSHIHTGLKNSKPIEDMVLECNPILESFGNCKTIRNNNSSRFGKFVRILIDKDMNISGAKIQNYLLQKSRVTSVSQNERSFHILYSLAKSKQKTELGLKLNQKYQYLQKSGCMNVQGIDDIQNFNIVWESLKDVGFEQQDIKTIFTVLSGILLIGNLQFDNKENSINPNSNCKYLDESLIERISNCLCIKRQQSDKLFLEHRRSVGKQVMIKRLDINQCKVNKNTLAKALYGRVFDYLVQKINKKLWINQKEGRSIGILDIFGFQVFAHNSLQQLCINFTNERLQKLFTKHIFDNEIQELKKDGLGDKIKNLNAPDNRQIIELIQKKMGISIFSLIDQKTTLGSAKDEDLISQFRKIKNKYLHVDPEPNRTKFMILHTQSPVVYQISGFRFKNQDSITPEIELLIDDLFPLKQNLQNKGKSVVTKFDKQLRNLNEQLQTSELHFIRCIKPNQQKTPLKVDEDYVLQQIKYMGILQAVQIRKNIFPHRIQYSKFIETYKVLLKIQDKIFSKLSPIQQSVLILKMLIPSIQKEKNAYELGNLKIYLKQQHEKRLNQLLMKEYQKRQKAILVIKRSHQKWMFRKKIIQGLKLLLKKNKILSRILKRLHKNITKLFFKQYLSKAKHKSQIIRNKQLTQQKVLLKKRHQCALQKFSQIQHLFLRYKKYLLFSKIRQFSQSNCMYDTVVNFSSIIPIQVPKTSIIPQPKQQIKNSLMDYSTVYQSVVEPVDILNEIAFKKQIVIPKYDQSRCNIKRLHLLITHSYSAEQMQQKQPPFSSDNYYQIHKNINQNLVKDLQNFKYIDFYQKVLRKKKTMFGRSKSTTETLRCKPDQMGRSLLLLQQNQEQKALFVFGKLLEIGNEHRSYDIYNLIEQVLEVFQYTSQTFKDQIFTQLLKQQSTSSEYPAIKMYQVMAILLHTQNISKQHLLAAMNWFLERYQSSSISHRLKQYINYIFPKLQRQYQSKNLSHLSFVPSRYQIMALMAKRQISIPVFFSVGKQVKINVDYYQTFNDIKKKVCESAGINSKRFNNQLLCFCEIVNYENQQMEEEPVDDDRIVWDLITEWETIADQFNQNSKKPPVIFLMIKLRYAFQLQRGDLQGIQLIYSQCYFDVFIGRIRIPYQRLIENAAIIRIVDPKINTQDTRPLWMINNNSQKQSFLDSVNQITKSLHGKQRGQLHFRFIKNCECHILCMTNYFNTSCNLKLFIKLRRIYILENDVIKHQISLRRALSWGVQGKTFSLEHKQNDVFKKIQIPMKKDNAKILTKVLEINMKIMMSYKGIKN